MKRLFGIVLMVVSLLGMAPRVLAGAPTQEEVPFEPMVLPSAYCGFEVRLEALTNKAKTIILSDREGNTRLFLTTGAFKLRITNLETNTFLDLNVSGPGHFEPLPDGSGRVTFLGASLGLAPDPSTNAGGLPSVNLHNGRVVVEFDAQGSSHIVSIHGRSQDVCALLAHS